MWRCNSGILDYSSGLIAIHNGNNNPLLVWWVEKKSKKAEDCLKQCQALVKKLLKPEN